MLDLRNRTYAAFAELGRYANCAWDAFGILGALDVDGRVESFCPDCGELYTIEVRDSAIDRSDLLFHCLVPAAHWWDDVFFT